MAMPSKPMRLTAMAPSTEAMMLLSWSEKAMV
jgi:hypothetical protein